MCVINCRKEERSHLPNQLLHYSDCTGRVLGATHGSVGACSKGASGVSELDINASLGAAVTFAADGEDGDVLGILGGSDDRKYSINSLRRSSMFPYNHNNCKTGYATTDISQNVPLWCGGSARGTLGASAPVALGHLEVSDCWIRYRCTIQLLLQSRKCTQWFES